MLTLVIIIILIALIFDFINGFHDAANSIATVVSTRVLTPRFAVMWAAFFNFIGAFGFETHVAKTMGSGMIQLSAVNEYVILAGLIGAIVWDLITWYFGLPTSSSHALIGAYAGAAIARVGLFSHHCCRLDQDAHLHRSLTDHRRVVGVLHDGDSPLVVPPLYPFFGGQVLWQAATRIGRPLQPWARGQ